VETCRKTVFQKSDNLPQQIGFPVIFAIQILKKIDRHFNYIKPTEHNAKEQHKFSWEVLPRPQKNVEQFRMRWRRLLWRGSTSCPSKCYYL